LKELGGTNPKMNDIPRRRLPKWKISFTINVDLTPIVNRVLALLAIH
jgi:hypothetical protein